MKNRIRLILCLSVTLGFSHTVVAATSFSNSLTGFTGDSTLPATQTAVAGVGGAGFNFWSTLGFEDPFTMDPTVVFDSSGATFGALFAGDDGRNYMRTNDDDYILSDFVAEITVDRSNNPSDVQSVFFGIGTGDKALFGVPDWSTLVPSTFFTTETGQLTYFRTANDVNEFSSVPAAIGTNDVQRYRMSYDSSARTMTYAVDVNYVDGPFVEDFTTGAFDLNMVLCPTANCGGGSQADFFGPPGTPNTWPTEASRIYFGGDDGVTFRDFSVVAEPAGMAPCDFDGSGTCTITDLDLLYGALGTANPTFDLNGSGTVDNDDITSWLAEASAVDPQGLTFVRGDTNLDGAVGGGDFTTLASNFGSAAGWGGGNFDDDGSVGGSDFTSLASNFGFSSLNAVPEPACGSLLMLGLLFWLGAGRRPRRLR